MKPEDVDQPMDEEQENKAGESAAPSAAPADTGPDETAPDQQTSQTDDYKDAWMRAAADLQNLQKRLSREKDLARRMAARDLIGALLPCFDNLQRAVASADKGSAEVLIQGVAMVDDAIQRTLQDHGVRVIDPQDQRLDPSLHEAVFSRHDEQVEENHILEVHEKGYALGDMVIRPARVAVSLGAPPAEVDAPDQDGPES